MRLSGHAFVRSCDGRRLSADKRVTGRVGHATVTAVRAANTDKTPGGHGLSSDKACDEPAAD